MKTIKNLSQGTPQILDKLITICIVALFFGLPLFFLNVAYQGIGFEKQYYFYFWTLLGVILWAAKSLLHGGMKIVRTSLDVPLILLWVVTALSTIFSLDRYHSVFGAFGAPSQGFLALTVAILAYFLINAHLNEARRHFVFWATILSGAFVTVWTFLGSIEWLGLSTELLARVPWGIGSLSTVVIFLAAMIPLYIVGFAQVSQQWPVGIKPKIKSIALAALLIANFFIFYSIFRAITFSEWMIVAVALAFFVVLLFSRIIAAPRRVILVSMLLFLVLVVFIFIDRSARTNAVALGEHKIGWVVAKNAVAADPIIGTGPGTYAYNFALHRPGQIDGAAVPQIRATNGPGLLMHALSTMGVLGFIATAIVMLVAIWTLIRSLTHTTQSNILVSAGLSVAALIVALTVFFTRFDHLLFLMSFLLIALAFVSLRQEKGEDAVVKEITFNTSPNHALALAFVYLILAVGALFGLVSLGKNVAADISMAQGLRAQAQEENTNVARGVIDAAQLNNKESRYLVTLAENSLVQANREAAKPEGERDTARVEGLVRAAEAAAQQARAIAPQNVRAQETVGVIYENAGQYLPEPIVRAREAYEQARELEPRNALYDLRLGMLKLIEVQVEETTEENQEQKRGMVEEAKVLFEAARDKNAAFAPAYYQLAIVHEALGDLDVAVGNMATAQQLIRNDLNYAFNLARLLQARGGDGDLVLAERIFKEILGVNDQEINAQFNLGLLYERTNRRDEAIAQYKNVLEILPENAPAREQIQQFVTTLENGGTNIASGQEAQSDDGQSDGQDSAQENSQESRVVVLNAGAPVGSAGTVRDTLQGAGFTRVTASNSTIDATTGARVVFASGQRAVAQSVAQAMGDAFGAATVSEDENLTEQNNADVIVIIGPAAAEVNEEN